MVKKHWAHTYNYEDFIGFVSFGLADAILNEYMTYAESNKNATYLSANTNVQFVKVISDRMKEETLEEIKWLEVSSWTSSTSLHIFALLQPSSCIKFVFIKLIKVAVTRWLSHGQARQTNLD